MIEKGQQWISETEKGEKYSQISEYLDIEITSSSKHPNGKKRDEITACQSGEIKHPENNLSSIELKAEGSVPIMSIADATCTPHEYGEHYIRVSEGGEADLHKHFNGCKKNPDHRQFIPVDTFTLNHLPMVHRDKDLYDFIKATADLTVRVDVKMTSPHRPEFWPNTKVSYPFYNMGGETTQRTGSGMVSSALVKYMDGKDHCGNKHRENFTKCWCKYCEDSDTASHVWWEFYVKTATHVVFDDIEAKQTLLRLFYDSKDNNNFIIVGHVSVSERDVESDCCRLKCATCDENLAHALTKCWKQYDDSWKKVRKKRTTCQNTDLFNFIVSHPHGCSKQVSFGHLVDKLQLRNNLTKFTYSTCTCPGSSGAFLHVFGYDVKNLVHSRALSTNLNYSVTSEILSPECKETK